MIGLDTNVLLRVFIEDEPVSQHAQCVALLRAVAPEPAMINPIVLAEATWTLSRRMKRSRRQVADFVADVLDAEVFDVPFSLAARRALKAYEHGRGDFADYLIAEINAEAGCRATFTFDTDAADHGHYSLLP